ncbi:hypothetical protein ACHAPT_012448 [Fusarium lateritium]
MATLDTLKLALRENSTATSSKTQQLSDLQYSHGFDILVRGSSIYQGFIIPQLALLLTPLTNSRSPISVLEIGPGPNSVLGYLPGRLRQKIGTYSAFEPNKLFATQLGEWLTGSPLPRLKSSPDIRPTPFDLNGASDGAQKFNLILFCHSMYGMNPKRKYIERALEMLADGGMVVVFHREPLYFDGLVCHQTASFPTGVTRVHNEDETLDSFAPLIAGFITQHADKALRAKWRKTCRTLGRQEGDHLLFISPEVMVAFDQHATALPELTALVPSVKDKTVKNREARVHHPASVMRPNNIRQVQQCVEWARKHQVGLTVIGGGHSGQCVRSNVVSVDMDAFDRVHILKAEEGSDSGSLVVAEAGCKTEAMIEKATEKLLTVPLGSRPSVGAGLWLQGGIGHLARLHGLTCDAIVGAVMVSVDSGKVLCIGNVPNKHRPAHAVRPQDEDDLLWALKGAGTNFGIVISVTFKAYEAPIHWVRNWIIPLENKCETRQMLKDVDLTAGLLPQDRSIDAYLYWQNNRPHLGVTLFKDFTDQFAGPSIPASLTFGREQDFKTACGVGLFDTEMYMSKMHGGHGGGKTSSFKRCLFLKDIGSVKITDVFSMALETRPSSLCYFHLLHGGEAVGDVKDDATAFGCRDWDFACVVTGVWPRDQDGTETARAATQWVYNVAERLLPVSTGVYGADLGPDPRDTALAAHAFGPNRPRLTQLKGRLDPGNVLAYACPLLKVPKQKLIILVTGESCAGKDYCANIWASVFTMSALRARVVSISDETKLGYAALYGADFERLRSDRAYKEQHRPALTKFFQDRLRRFPWLFEEEFQHVLGKAADVDVLLITGMRDEAPLAVFSSFVPDSRLIEVRVQASNEMRQARRGSQGGSGSSNSEPNWAATFVFNNDTTGEEAARRFSNRHLLPFFHEDLQRLAGMVSSVSDFPSSGVNFRHVLNIVQHPDGLTLCTSLLKTRFAGAWANVDVIACCEAGGFLFASPLAQQVGVPLALIRKGGKLPPPTVSVDKGASHISSFTPDGTAARKIEMNPDLITRGQPVVVVDDVLATGTTLCAVLKLLCKAGARVEDISLMVVAEFPFHGGRELLQSRGFGGVNIQSLLVFGGA